jgi:hypothetical protein
MKRYTEDEEFRKEIEESIPVSNYKALYWGIVGFIMYFGFCLIITAVIDRDYMDDSFLLSFFDARDPVVFIFAILVGFVGGMFTYLGDIEEKRQSSFEKRYKKGAVDIIVPEFLYEDNFLGLVNKSKLPEKIKMVCWNCNDKREPEDVFCANCGERILC